MKLLLLMEVCWDSLMVIEIKKNTETRDVLYGD